MEHVIFCALCDLDEAWTTEEAAQAAAVQHVWSAHPDMWVTVMGEERLPRDITPPEAYGRQFEPWERQPVPSNPKLN